MEGIIFFADDNVFDNTFENKLFVALSKEKKHPVLPIANLELLESSIKSSSSIKALIVDWNFKKDVDAEGVEVPDETPFELLSQAELFSLIYIYSENAIESTEQGQKLKAKFEDKLKFRQKQKDNGKIEEEKNIILDDLHKMQESNTSLSLPIKWTQAINQSVQKIFYELNSADPNWTKEIFESSTSDGVEPNSEVIGVFQHLLSESIIQDKELIDSITEQAQKEVIPVTNKELSLAKLYHRLYYTRLTENAPIMTGDIFKINDETAAILITPECDIRDKQGEILEFLITKSDLFKNNLIKVHTFTIGETELKGNRSKNLFKIFNQEEMKIHILPSFPFMQDVYNITALVDFKTSVRQIKHEDFSKFERVFKINSPYIHQLRQRYLAYIGRVGVPAIPNSLRGYNLK